MSVPLLTDWRLPGCGEACRPKRHDPYTHELYGLRTGVLVAQVAPTLPTVVRTGPLIVDLAARTVTVDGAPVHLTGREWGLLACLARRVGRFCSNRDIVAEAWGEEYVSDQRRRTYPTVLANDHLICINVSRLRRKLGPAARLLVSVPNKFVPGRRLELEPPS